MTSSSLRDWGKKGKPSIDLWFHLLILYFLLAAFWILSLTQLEIENWLFFLTKKQHKQIKDFTSVLSLQETTWAKFNNNKKRIFPTTYRLVSLLYEHCNKKLSKKLICKKKWDFGRWNPHSVIISVRAIFNFIFILGLCQGKWFKIRCFNTSSGTFILSKSCFFFLLTLY